MKGTSSLYNHVQGTGIPILMIHGIISDGSFFEETAGYLSEKYRVITYDRRGYGKSNKEKYEDYSVYTQAEDAAALLRELCREAAWVVGNSAGGLIGLELALNHPELVRGLILIEPSLGYDETEREKLLAWNRELNEYVNEGKIKRALPAFSRVIGAGGETRKGTSLKEMRQTYQNLSAFLYGELNEVQHYLPEIDRLKQLDIPVIIAVTERGRESIFATSSQTAAEQIGWPVVHFPGYHNAAREMPLEFALMVHGILSLAVPGTENYCI